MFLSTCQVHAPDKPCTPAKAVPTPARSGRAPKGADSKTGPKTAKKTLKKNQKSEKLTPAACKAKAKDAACRAKTKAAGCKAKAKPAAVKKVYKAKTKDEVERKMHSVS